MTTSPFFSLLFFVVTFIIIYANPLNSGNSRKIKSVVTSILINTNKASESQILHI